jgi:hypothetical protein
VVTVINVSKVIHSREFEKAITIVRTHGGKFVGNDYQTTQEIIQTRGVIVNPKNSKEVEQTPQGDRATGYLKIYVDKSIRLYATRERISGNNDISDIIVENYGTDYATQYRLVNIYDRSQWGYIAAEAVRMNAR